MAKPRSAKTEEIPIYSPVQCPPNCAAITSCHKYTEGNIIKSTDFEMYHLRKKKHLHTALRYVKQKKISNKFYCHSSLKQREEAQSHVWEITGASYEGISLWSACLSSNTLVYIRPRGNKRKTSTRFHAKLLRWHYYQSTVIPAGAEKEFVMRCFSKSVIETKRNFFFFLLVPGTGDCYGKSE